MINCRLELKSKDRQELQIKSNELGKTQTTFKATKDANFERVLRRTVVEYV